MLEEVESHSPSIVAQSPEIKSVAPSATDLAMLTVDELWNFRQLIDEVLVQKIASELASLKGRLELLNPKQVTKKRVSRKPPEVMAEKRRPYPSVLPKYRNPKKPSETWSGRGRQPRWVQAQLGLGKQLQDLLIS
jgi:DNA-binding protein H-NS